MQSLQSNLESTRVRVDERTVCLLQSLDETKTKVLSTGRAVYIQGVTKQEAVHTMKDQSRQYSNQETI